MLPELSGIRHRGTSCACRRQVRFNAVQSRHRSQAIAPGAVGIRPDRPITARINPFGVRLPLPLDPESEESRGCAAESSYCRRTRPNRPAAPAPARSVVTSWKERKWAWGHQRLAVASRASAKDRNVRIGLQSLSRHHMPSCLPPETGQRGHGATQTNRDFAGTLAPDVPRAPSFKSTRARPASYRAGLCGGGYWGSSGRTLAAWAPFGPGVTSNSTACPSSSER